MQVFNPCAPFFNEDDKFNYGLQGIRKGIVVELFLTYFIYFLLIMKGTMSDMYPPHEEKQKKNIVKGNESGDIGRGSDDERAKKQQEIDGGEVQLSAGNKELWKLEEFFYTFYQYHIICAGMALLYAPYAFLITICYLHFGCFIGIIGLNIKPKQTQEEKDKITKFTKILFTICQFFNIVIIITGLVGLGQTKKEDYSACTYLHPNIIQNLGK